MNLAEKTAVVDEIAADLEQAKAILAVDYRGISVAEIAELRSQLYEADSKLRIVKNTLSRRAVDQAGVDALKEYLIGPTAFAFIGGDIAQAAKALNGFASDGEPITFKGGLMDGNLLSADDIKRIAKLPARDILNGQLTCLVASPLTGLARGMNGLLGGLAIALAQIREQKISEEPKPQAEEPVEEPVIEEPAEIEGAAEEDATEDLPDEDLETEKED